MNLAKYVSADRMQELTAVGDVRAARTIMEAASAKREELRKPIETGDVQFNPEKIKDSLSFRLGQIEMAQWILELPDRAREYIQRLPEGEK